jgi:hypothetical protein
VPFFLGRLLPAVEALPRGSSLTETYDSRPAGPPIDVPTPPVAPVPLAPSISTVAASVAPVPLARSLSTVAASKAPVPPARSLSTVAASKAPVPLARSLSTVAASKAPVPLARSLSTVAASGSSSPASVSPIARSASGASGVSQGILGRSQTASTVSASSPLIIVRSLDADAPLPPTHIQLRAAAPSEPRPHFPDPASAAPKSPAKSTARAPKRAKRTPNGFRPRVPTDEELMPKKDLPAGYVRVRPFPFLRPHARLLLLFPVRPLSRQQEAVRPFAWR